MKIMRLTAVLLFTTLIASCGGGSSSGSGNDYSGTGSFQLFTTGSPLVFGSLNLTVSIRGQTVTISTSFGTDGSAPLSSSGNEYIVPVNINLSSGTSSCSGEVVFSGIITGDATSGGMSGNLPCRNGGVSFRTTFTGTFSART